MGRARGNRHGDLRVPPRLSRYGLTTKRAAVDLALRRLDLEPMGRDDALAMRGTGWEADLEQLREGYLRSSS